MLKLVETTGPIETLGPQVHAIYCLTGAFFSSGFRTTSVMARLGTFFVRDTRWTSACQPDADAFCIACWSFREISN